MIGWFMALALVGAFIPTQTRGSRCGFSLLIIGMCCVRSPTFGRDDGRFANSPLKPWFDSLKSGKGPCCSDADGNVVSDADWESKEGGYRVRIAGEWHDVPDNAVMTTPNLYGRTMV